MTDRQYRALLDLLMCCDPWPMPDDVGDETQNAVTSLANDEARARGYADWTDAYHRFGSAVGEVP